jgi:putative ABC transport system permease protein
MISNYVKVAIRDIKKKIVFSAINVLGLSISLTACLIIVVYVSFEFSFEDYHQNADKIYRIRMDINSSSIHSENASTYPIVKNLIKDQFADVSRVVRVKQKKGIILREEEGYPFVKFNEDNILYVDEEFLEVFSFPLIAGNKVRALLNPNSVVLTESMARKYFGNSANYNEIIGSSIQKIGSTENEVLKITGICMDVPKNSHLNFDFLISYKSIYGWKSDDGEDYKSLAENSSEWSGFFTYVLVEHDLSASRVKNLEKAITDLIVKNFSQVKRSDKYEFLLQPIKKIHLESHLDGEYSKNGEKSNVYLLMVVSFLLLSITIVNYVNLSSSKTSERYKEVGVRKVLGSGRKQIIVRFLIESLVTTLISTVLAVTLFLILWSSVKNYFNLDFYYPFWKDSTFYLFILLSFVLNTLIYTLYPIILLSNFSPVVALHGGFLGSKGGRLRKFLVIFQFFVASILIAGSLTAYKQMSFMKEADTGIKIDSILILKAPKVPTNRERYLSTNEVFKTELTGLSLIKNVTTGVRIPGEEMASQTLTLVDDESKEFLVNIIGVDQDYLKTFELKTVAGRNFSKTPAENPELLQFNELRVNFGSNDHSIIINESASKLLGFKNPNEALGQNAYLFGTKKVIIGVVPDYYHQSVKETFKPTVFYIQQVYSNYYILSLEKSASLSHVISLVNKSWNKFYPKDPFEYFFLDDFYNEQYKKDNQFQKVFTSFAVLTVFVACLGLFALSLFTISKRSKEIAIRKINGASTMTIITSILNDFMRLVLIALIISIPLSFLLFSKWLENFSYRISLGFWLVWIPSLTVLLLAILIVLYQTIIAARGNPIKYLRYE